MYEGGHSNCYRVHVQATVGIHERQPDPLQSVAQRIKARSWTEVGKLLTCKCVTP